MSKEKYLTGRNKNYVLKVWEGEKPVPGVYDLEHQWSQPTTENVNLQTAKTGKEKRKINHI